VVTVGFAIFVDRAVEWEKGLNSEFVVLGQGTNQTNPCATFATGTSGVQTTKVIPQVVVGSFDGGLTKYSTYVEIVNVSGTAQNVTANFYNEDASAMAGVAFTAGSATLANGTLPATSVAKDGVLVISGETATTRGLGWGKITSCGTLSVSSFFELRDAVTNVLLSRVGVAPSSGTTTSFVIPRVRDASAGLDVGLAVVNTAAAGTADVTLTAELKDASGNTIASKPIKMPAGWHQQFFMKDLFGLNDAAGRTYQYVKFSAPMSPTFAAIALAIEGGTLTSFPVDVLQ